MSLSVNQKIPLIQAAPDDEELAIESAAPQSQSKPVQKVEQIPFHFRIESTSESTVEDFKFFSMMYAAAMSKDVEAAWTTISQILNSLPQEKADLFAEWAFAIDNDFMRNKLYDRIERIVQKSGIDTQSTTSQTGSSISGTSTPVDTGSEISSPPDSRRSTPFNEKESTSS